MTLTTLHLYGISKDAIESLLMPGDALRELNAPWLSLVATHAPENDELARLEKLATRLTKASEDAIALLFFYFDDDGFLCRLFKRGKCLASCRNDDSWAKLGKHLNALFDDEAPAKSLRCASRCVSLDEQVQLLEETLGVALLDCSEEAPRVVPRSDALMQVIKARETALRRRPKQYALTELERDDWPEFVCTEQELFEFLRPNWRSNGVSKLLYRMGYGLSVIPYHPHLAAYPYVDAARSDHLLIYDRHTGNALDLITATAQPSRVLWQTRKKEAVCLFMQILQEGGADSRWFRRAGKGYVACIGMDGGERWRFAPPLEEHQTLSYVHTSAEGIITLFVPQTLKYDSMLWRIDGETGRLLHARRIPAKDELLQLVRIKTLDGFLYAARQTGELVVLDASLEEKVRFPGFKRSPYIQEENVVGSLLWQKDGAAGPLCLYDLSTGQMSQLHLELPVYILAVLPDGRILGVNEKQNLLTVFDRTGIVVSRCSVPGMLSRICQESDRICLVETRAPGSPIISKELLDATSLHVWRMDPAGSTTHG